MQPKRLKLPAQAALLQVMVRQRVCDARLANLAVCMLREDRQVFKADTVDPPQASIDGAEMAGSGGAEDSVAMPGVGKQNFPQHHLPESAVGQRKGISGSSGVTGHVETDPVACTIGLGADAPSAKAAHGDLLLNRGACSSHAVDPQDMPNPTVPRGNGHQRAFSGSLPVHAAAVLPQCECQPATVLDLVSRCKALSGIVAMSRSALQGQNGSPETARDFVHSAGIAVEWVLYVITDLSWRFRALCEHMNPALYRSMLAAVLHSVGEIAWVLDAVATRGAEPKPSAECRAASKALVDEMRRCLAVEVARLEAAGPLDSSLENSLRRQAHIGSLLSGNATPAGHLVLTVNAMVLLGMSKRYITAVLRHTTPLVMSSRCSTTVGDLLRLHSKYSICDYDCLDHYFSIVVELMNRGQGIQRRLGQLQVLNIAAHALRVQYLPCEAARQVIADLAVVSIEDRRLHVRTFSSTCFIAI